MNSLPMLLQTLHVALDLIIHIYMIHVIRFVSDLVSRQNTGLLMTRHIHVLTNVLLTICVTFLYNGKDSTIHTNLS